jgi:peptide/nickel transport system substrate-binding protein
MAPAGRRNRWSGRLGVAGIAFMLLVAACGGGSASNSASGQTSPGTPQRGGSLNYLVSGPLANWDRGLDPATGGAAPSIFEDAIFGELFRLSSTGSIEPNLATGSALSDGGKTLTLSLRQGVIFQDGTPFDASAVAWNIKRDLTTPCVCSPVSSWPALGPEGITTPDTHTVAIHFIRPYGAVIPALMSSSVNHVASPTAVQRLGADFRLKPVGAGPFTVVSNLVSSKLELQRYDGYWKKGQPYLDRLTFTTIAGDQPAYQAMLAGQAQAGGLTTPSLIRQASQNQSLTVALERSTAPWVIQLNTAIPPFNNKLAREAIYYATDPDAMRVHLFDNVFTATQSFTGPAGLFYEPKVPGYRTHNVAKAKQLVSQLGGLNVDLFAGNDTISTTTLQALQTQWNEAGIHTTIRADADLTRIIQEFTGKKWQAALQLVGAYDPAVGAALPFRYLSSAVYSGVHDQALDQMLDQAAASTDKNARTGMYAQIAKYISDQAYSPYLFGGVVGATALKTVHGPGLTSANPLPGGFPAPKWDEAWMSKG